jgi:hypothetical protein
MNSIEKPVGNALSEWLGAERVEHLKDMIVEKIINQVEEDLREQFDLTIDGGCILEISNDALEEVSKKIKKMYKDKYLEVAEQAIARIGAGSNEAD